MLVLIFTGRRRIRTFEAIATDLQSAPFGRSGIHPYAVKKHLESSINSQNRIVYLTQPILHRKEVIQPHLPIRLPCYDFTPVTGFTFGGSFLTVRSPTSGASNSHGVTGGVYKARERIHRDILIRDY